MMRGRGDWHKWKSRVQRQQLALRDSERRSLVLVPLKRGWHEWNGVLVVRQFVVRPSRLHMQAGRLHHN